MLTCCLLATSCRTAKIQHPTDTRQENVWKDVPRLYRDDEDIEICGPLSLANAVEISLDNHWEIRYQSTELWARKQQAVSDFLALWPKFDFRLDQAYRFSPLLTIGSAPTAEQVTSRWSVESSQELLNWALDGYRARQSARSVVLLDQQHLRIRQNTVFDVVKSYWLTRAYSQILRDGHYLSERLDERILTLDRQVEDHVISRQQALDEHARLLELKENLVQYKGLFHESQARLLTLMGLHPCTSVDFENIELKQPNQWDLDIANLESAALHLRPELYVKDMEQEISQLQARSNFAALFPTVRLFGNYNEDYNQFLVYQDWVEVGFRLTQNIVNLPSQWWAYKASNTQARFSEYERLATSVAIIGQLHLALIALQSTEDLYNDSWEQYCIAEEQVELAKLERSEGLRHDAEILQMELNAYVFKAEALVLHARYLSAVEGVANSVGVPLIGYGLEVDHMQLSNQNEMGHCGL